MSEITTFKDGTEGLQGFDRLVHFDPRSRQHRLQVADQVVVPNEGVYGWDIPKHLDQGSEGACVGAGLTHVLISEPFEALGLDMQYAKERIYWAAQDEDPWPGSSRPGDSPFYEGTAVLAGLQVIRRMAWIDSYQWTFSLKELISGVANIGPAVMGLRWYEGMHRPDRSGFIRPTGALSGGHCIACKEVDCDQGHFTLHNSWGESWGEGGDCYITFGDMATLLSEQGEAAFLSRV